MDVYAGLFELNQQMRVIGRGLYVESLTARTHEVHGHTQGKFLLIKLKNVSSTRKLGPTGCIFAQKEVPPCFAKKTIHPVDSWDPSNLVADLWAY